MRSQNINSNLKAITMLDAICHWDEKRISAERKFQGESRWCAVEACAQLCALHVRRCCGFSRHAFLLALSSITPLPPKTLSNTAGFEARLKGISQRAFSYIVTIRFESYRPILADLIIGTMDYGQQFQQTRLRRHYQQLFSYLCRNGSRG